MIHKGEGFSRDISSHGVYVYAEWDVRPQSDAEIDVDILLNSFSETRRTVHMGGSAKVVRVEPSATDEHSGGVVAASDSFAFKEEHNLTSGA